MTEKSRGILSIAVIAGRNLKLHGILGLLETCYDPWVEVILEDRVILSSAEHTNDPNPKFNIKATIPYCYDSNLLIVKVYDNNLLLSHLIGEAVFEIFPLDKKWSKKDWYPLGNSGDILIDISYAPYIGSQKILQPEPLGLESYFSAKTGGVLRLYQDAETTSAKNYETNTSNAGNCFSEIKESIQKARKFIYIAGWSLWTILKLTRDGTSEATLGDLLKMKADEGVVVLIMVWSEALSVGLCNELFGTHAVETVEYFQDTNVVCVSVMRESFNNESIKNKFVSTVFTHHMKLLVTDDPKCETVGYIGGIDLTDGRWDFPDHALWKTLKTLHKGDFYNGYINVDPHNGPREPWHDLHAKVVGVTAQDLISVFEEKWRRQASQHAFKLVSHSFENGDNDINGGQWNLQILRTSDSNSSLFQHSSDSLISIDGSEVDNSICHGIVNLIRSANRFIYMETQYFLGSSYAWQDYKTVAQNIVPAEIAEQISYSIKFNSPIRVYIVIPMAPEGDSTSTIGSAYMTDILLWQYLTIKMMYRRIARAISDASLDTHPEDYLLFLCLGRKLSKPAAARNIDAGASNISDVWREKRRFPIYVHSKMILSDDARIIVGSANFNQRSLDGSRDTEAAIAGSQTTIHDDTELLVTDGEVSRFRKSLWFEHTEGDSKNNSIYNDPSSIDCIRHIRTKSEKAFDNYVDDSYEEDLKYRFLKYPLLISKSGDVTAIPDYPNIPDFNIPATGQKSYIPSVITT